MKMRKPKKESLHTALWNIAAIVSIVAVIFRNGNVTISSTVLATIYHVVVLVINEDYI